MQKPLLSVGIIFKNEIRCLERCLRSLQPLREKISCEVVMADTGSDDGSREIAANYADILFDFPWIDDFAAARNAVMNRCSGTWYFSIDADEWMDKDISELTEFLKKTVSFNWASLHIYNYKSAQLNISESYADFLAMRMVRLSTEARYIGKIHERLVCNSAQMQRVYLLNHTILHHDGYAYTSKVQQDKKTERNMRLLREALQERPRDLPLLLQCAESANGLDCIEYVQRAVDEADEQEGWAQFGPPILRRAVQALNEAHSPDVERWIVQMEAEFPNSIFMRVDVSCYAFSFYFSKQNFLKSIYYGEMYLQAISDYRAGRYDYEELLYSALALCAPIWEKKLRIYLADVYQRTGRTESAVAMLTALDEAELNEDQTRDFIKALRYIHASSDTDTASLLWHLWEKSDGEDGRSKGCRTVFLKTAAEAFTPSYRCDETERGDYRRHAYTVFLPLLGQENCELGTAAAILETENRLELEKLLGTVESWDEFPVYALEHALLEGVRFPIPGKPMKIEEMDGLAARMARPDGPLAGMAVLAADEDSTDWQSLAWARGLALAAVKSCDWENTEQGMELCRAFAKTENAFLPKYYTADLLCDENIQLLPPMHRFGWYCGRACWALDAGDSAAYVRLLRQGLETCPEMKSMVEFLLKRLEESQKIPATPELLRLAEQVRTLLSMYPADDPAVEALKQSAAYQKVAHLIEGPKLGVLGGLAQ